MRSMLIPLSLLLLPLLARPALASDGVLEINQTCAVETGCFPGDTPGYPVTIGSGGSYRFTSDLFGIAANLDGIFLNASRVDIDFNGFALRGPRIGSGTGNGISGGGTDGSFAGNTVLRNGLIRGFRARGVALAGAARVRVEDLVVEANAGGGLALGDHATVVGATLDTNGGSTTTAHGISVGVDSRVRDCSVRNTGGRGIDAGDRSKLSGNGIETAGDDGISCGESCVIRSNSSFDAGLAGIETGPGSIVQSNTVRDSGQAGISTSASVISDNAVIRAGAAGIVGGGGVISGNVVSNSGAEGIAGSLGTIISENLATSSDGDGILTGSRGLVERNVIRDSGGSGTGQGLVIIGNSGYRGNVVNGNSTGTISGGVDLGGNICDGNTICP